MPSPGDELSPLTDAEITAAFAPLAGRRLALAVSGGVDSMVLLHLLARWLPSAAEPASAVARTSGLTEQRDIGLPRLSPLAPPSWLPPPAMSPPGIVPKAVVLTVDHGLRPEAATEAEFVQKASARLGFPHATLHWRRSQQDGHSGLQEKARHARYDLIADQIEAECWARRDEGHPDGAPLAPHSKRAIVTAHQRDDQIETFLMRLGRGAALDGLSAMRTFDTLVRRPTTARPYPAAVHLLRPLLAVPRTRILATAAALGVEWREDPSNADVRFERIRVRTAMPALGSFGLAPSTLQRSIHRLQRSRSAIQDEVVRRMSGRGDTNPTYQANDGLFATIRLSGRSDDEIDLRILRHAILAFGGSATEPALEQVEGLLAHLAACRTQAAQLVGNGGVWHPKAEARTLGGCRIDYHLDARDPSGASIRLWRELGRHAPAGMRLAPGDGGWWDDRFAISLAPAAPAPVLVREVGAALWSRLRRDNAAMAWLRHIPPGAGAALPAVWRQDGTLLAVPCSGVLSNPHITARFAPVVEAADDVAPT